MLSFGRGFTTRAVIFSLLLLTSPADSLTAVVVVGIIHIDLIRLVTERGMARRCRLQIFPQAAHARHVTFADRLLRRQRALRLFVVNKRASCCMEKLGARR